MERLLLILFIYILMIMLCYITSPKRILLTPQMGYIVAFVPGLFYALFYVKKWDLYLSSQTVFVLIVGAISFVFTSIVIQTLYYKSHISQIRFNNNGVNEIIISKWKIYILTIYDIFVCLWSLIYLISKFGNSISSAIYAYRKAYILGEDVANLGVILSNVRFISFTLGLIWAYLIVHGIIFKYNSHRKKYIFNYCICIITDLLSGARGDSLLLFVATFIMMYFLYSMKNSWVSKIGISTMLKIVMIFAIILIAYQSIGNLLGRESYDSNSDFIAKYLAAEIKNLDVFIRNGKQNTDCSEWLTLRVIFTNIQEYFGIDLVSDNIYQFGSNRNFLSVNGYNLGNVYSTYFNYVHDLGSTGAVVFPIIMAATSQLFFWKAIKSSSINRNSNINIQIIVYSYVYFTILMSFFSERFFDYVFNVGFVKRILILYILRLFMVKSRIYITVGKRKK